MSSSKASDVASPMPAPSRWTGGATSDEEFGQLRRALASIVTGVHCSSTIAVEVSAVADMHRLLEEMDYTYKQDLFGPTVSEQVALEFVRILQLIRDIPWQERSTAWLSVNHIIVRILSDMVQDPALYDLRRHHDVTWQFLDGLKKKADGAYFRSNSGLLEEYSKRAGQITEALWTPMLYPRQPPTEDTKNSNNALNLNRQRGAVPLISREGPGAPETYTKPFTTFLTENPTVFHAVKYFADKLVDAGYTKLSERSSWSDEVQRGGKYFLERNGSSLIAFVVGSNYKSGDGVAMIAGHVDALTAKLKPISTKKTTAGYVQLGVAPYAGSLNTTWWDRDLGIGGRVLVKDPETGKVESILAKLDYPIARIPTLAPHFGVGMLGTNNAETQAVPIIGLDNSDLSDASTPPVVSTLGKNSFASTQPPALLSAIASAAGVEASNIVNWELELFDTQPAQTGGLKKDFIFGGRIDDKLCSWAAVEGFLVAPTPKSSINLVALFDDEEIGSLLRQGARGNFLPSTIERISEVFSEDGKEKDALGRTYANSFLVSSDVTHAVNPNFLPNYMEQHAPRLNVGVVVSADSNGHMTTDAVSTAFVTRIAELAGCTLQVFQIRNDSRSGGTVGPMLSSAMGVRAVDVGIPQLSMHSVRATTGSLDPGLGVKLFHGVYKWFEKVGAEYDF